MAKFAEFHFPRIWVNKVKIKGRGCSKSPAQQNLKGKHDSLPYRLPTYISWWPGAHTSWTASPGGMFPRASLADAPGTFARSLVSWPGGSPQLSTAPPAAKAGIAKATIIAAP
jgi:hypothetical protein